MDWRAAYLLLLFAVKAYGVLKKFNQEFFLAMYVILKKFIIQLNA